MSEASPRSMTVDEFLLWAEGHPGRHGLVDGWAVGMAPERIGHAETRVAAQTALKGAIERSGVSCHMLPDGITVSVDAETAYEPDALICCGARLPRNETVVPAPVIVVEVLSPSTRHTDAGAKLAGYFTPPSVRHYLMVDPNRRVVVHHRREDPEIATRILGHGPLRLDPPGLDLAVKDLLGEAGGA